MFALLKNLLSIFPSTALTKSIRLQWSGIWEFQCVLSCLEQYLHGGMSELLVYNIYVNGGDSSINTRDTWYIDNICTLYYENSTKGLKERLLESIFSKRWGSKNVQWETSQVCVRGESPWRLEVQLGLDHVKCHLIVSVAPSCLET